MTMAPIMVADRQEDRDRKTEQKQSQPVICRRKEKGLIPRQDRGTIDIIRTPE